MPDMINQYVALLHKAQERHPHCFVFFRLGEFYEMFFDQAKKGSELLSLTLTKRGKVDGMTIPMCGMPAHTVDRYIAALLKLGYPVALVDQVETPEEAKKRKSKTVKRDIVRIYTQGTVLEESLIQGIENQYVIALSPEIKGCITLAYADISTKEFRIETLQKGQENKLLQLIVKLRPKEVIFPKQNEKLIAPLYTDQSMVITPLPDFRFDFENAVRTLKNYYQLDNVQGLGLTEQAEYMATGGLIEYISLLYPQNLPELPFPRKLQNVEELSVDPNTLTQLEIVESADGGHKGSLAQCVNRTVTPGGYRLLIKRFLSLPKNHKIIENRHQRILFFIDHETLANEMREKLQNLPDVERVLGRLSVNRGGPRDLYALGYAIDTATAVKLLLHTQITSQDVMCDMIPLLGEYQHIADTILRMLEDSLPQKIDFGGYIKSGVDSTLDNFRSLALNGEKYIDELAQKYAFESGVNVKIKHNNQLGYYIETKNNNPLTGDHFIHRQTTLHTIRYTSKELRSLGQNIVESTAQAIQREAELFQKMVVEVQQQKAGLSRMAKGLAKLDWYLSGARVATQYGYCKPVFKSKGDLIIIEGRHAMVEQQLIAMGKAFTPNDCVLGDKSRISLITGPNMAGKSTYLRGIAQIAILAHTGYFVPADRCEIPPMDGVMSRIGTSDDLARGISTFMMEMIDLALILNRSTAQSLIILDEVGRGTSTHDGIAIARATLEYLHNQIGAKVLFATHYRELTTLKQTLKGLDLYMMEAKPQRHNVIFTHKLIPGVAAHSYGIYVARLAGVPKEVVKRAAQILTASNQTVEPQLPIKNTTLDTLGHPSPTSSPIESPTQSHVCVEALKNLAIDELTPKQALMSLYELKQKIENNE